MKRTKTVPRRKNDMKNYLLTIFGSTEQEAAWEHMTPEQMQEGLARYMAFTQKLVDEGRMIAGEGLSPIGATIKPGNIVTDGPYVLAKEMVGGFYFFKAESLEDAITVAKECPALIHGSTVEVREQMEY
jgi:hypothetical protein